jgi:hypothetical protein
VAIFWFFSFCKDSASLGLIGQKVSNRFRKAAHCEFSSFYLKPPSKTIKSSQNTYHGFFHFIGLYLKSPSDEPDGVVQDLASSK